jgi:hypothetical protein
MEEKTLKLARGRNVFAMDVSRFQSGSYILGLRASSGIINARLMKQ